MYSENKVLIYSYSTSVLYNRYYSLIVLETDFITEKNYICTITVASYTSATYIFVQTIIGEKQCVSKKNSEP